MVVRLSVSPPSKRNLIPRTDRHYFCSAWPWLFQLECQYAYSSILATFRFPIHATIRGSIERAVSPQDAQSPSLRSDPAHPQLLLRASGFLCSFTSPLPRFMALLALNIVAACPSAADALCLLKFHGTILYEPAHIFSGDSVCDVRDLFRIEPYSAFPNTKHLSSESLLVR